MYYKADCIKYPPIREENVTDFNTYRGIGASISFRAGLMAELAVKLAEQDTQDAEMRERLLQKAPEELRKWIDDDMVLIRLFRYGKYDTNISFGDLYNFKDVHDTKIKMLALGKAWKDVVRIKLGHPDGTPQPHRISVYLAAVM